MARDVARAPHFPRGRPAIDHKEAPPLDRVYTPSGKLWAASTQAAAPRRTPPMHDEIPLEPRGPAMPLFTRREAFLIVAVSAAIAAGLMPFIG